MKISAKMICTMLALACFVLATFDAPIKINLVALGLSLLTLGLIL